jgi:hypothetical protein
MNENIKYVGAWHNIGKKRWMRFCKPENYFVKYGGFGISKHIIRQLIACYEGDTDQVLKFIYKGKLGIKKYETNLNNFLLSDKEFDNYGDVQKIVSLKDMILLQDNTIEVEEEVIS